MRALVLMLLLACGGAEVERAKAARYDAELEVVLAGVVDVVRAQNFTFEAMPPSTIKTAWHQAGTVAQPLERRPFSPLDRSPDVSSPGPSGGRNFVRFDIAISATRPFAIEVRGYAAFWKTGMTVPTELRGADEPSWLAARVDRLRSQIHKRLADYAR